MRVLLLDLEAGFGSAQAQTLLLASSLAERGFAPLTACERESGLAGHLEEAGLPVAPLPRGSLLNPAFVWVLERLLRRRRIRILHALGRRAGRVGNIFKRLHGDRLLLVHSRRDSPRCKVRSTFYARAQAVTCPTAETAAQLTAAGVPPPKVGLLPFCVERGRFARRRPRNDGRFVFQVLAPLIPESGLSVLIEAMSLIREMDELPPWEVRIAGSGPLFREVLDQAVQLGTASQLALLGDQDPAVLLPDADTLVSPSTYSDIENLDIKQSRICGVPVVAATSPAHAELIRDKHDGLLTPAGNPVALAAAMVRCMTEPTLRARLAKGGAARAAEYDADIPAEAALGLYRRLDAHWPDPAGPSVRPATDEAESGEAS